MGYIGCGAVGGHASPGAVRDAVLFGVHSCLFVAMNDTRGMRSSRKESVVATANNTIVLHENAPYMESRAGRSGRDKMRHRHKIVCPSPPRSHMYASMHTYGFILYCLELGRLGSVPAPLIQISHLVLRYAYAAIRTAIDGWTAVRSDPVLRKDIHLTVLQRRLQPLLVPSQ